MATSQLLLALAAILCAAQASYPDKHTVANQFIVTWSPLPGGLFQTMGFYDMPRTTSEAAVKGFAKAADRTALDHTTVWCRNKDYRVCPLFDKQGSVAGIQVSHSAEEIKATRVPLDMEADPQWFRQMVVGTEVFSTITYFVDAATLESGRAMTKHTLTAPNGIRILETRGAALSSMDVPAEESGAEPLGFVKQNCFIGMGQHYFLELSDTSSCEKSRPYFTLYGKKTKTLHGFGVTAFGKISKGSRNWFEQPPVLAVKMISPHHPACLIDWVKKYTLNTIHVFFIPKPWKTCCLSFF